MKKFFLIFLLSSFYLSAQSAGNTGLSFLKFGFGARNVAMSDLGVVSVNDLTALNYNPSLLALNKNTQLIFSHNSLFEDLTSEMIGAGIWILGMPVAIGVNTTTISDIEIRTRPGDPESKFNAHYFSGSLSAAYSILENLYAGATIKYIYENIYTDDASGWGVDIGLNYSGWIENLTVGAAIRNIGSMNNLHTQSSKLPTDLRIGASYKYELNSYNLKINALTGFQKLTDANDSHIHFGTEIIYDNTFALRGGYVTGYDSKTISTGFGILWKGLNLDYAYVPYKYGLGDSHIITFIYSFN